MRWAQNRPVAGQVGGSALVGVLHCAARGCLVLPQVLTSAPAPEAPAPPSGRTRDYGARGGSPKMGPPLPLPQQPAGGRPGAGTQPTGPTGAKSQGRGGGSGGAGGPGDDPVTLRFVAPAAPGSAVVTSGGPAVLRPFLVAGGPGTSLGLGRGLAAGVGGPALVPRFQTFTRAAPKAKRAPSVASQADWLVDQCDDGMGF
jgi:hypothetical protein